MGFSPLRKSRPLILLLGLITVFSLTVGASAGPKETYYKVTVRIAGLPPFYSTGVWAGGAFRGTVSGGGELYVEWNGTSLVMVEEYVPSGYPYYPGFPFHAGYWGVAYVCLKNCWNAPPNQTSTVTFYYFPIYYLEVKSPRGHPKGTGWYPAGSWAQISVEDMVEESENVRYKFDHWEGGRFSLDPSEALNAVLMDGPKTVEALWRAQYRIVVLTDHGKAKGEGWYDEGAMATVSVEPPIEVKNGTRYVFSGWTGDLTSDNPTVTLTVAKPILAVANWKKQYYLDINPNGGVVDQQSQWLDEGATLTINAATPCNVTEKKSRLIFTGWSGSVTSTSPSVTIIMDEPKSVSANWKKQYYLQVISEYGLTTGEGWYDEGSAASFSVTPTRLKMERWGWLGAARVFSGWVGDVEMASPIGTTIMDKPKRVEAVWEENYFWSYVTASIMASAAAVGGIFWKRDVIAPALKPFVKRLYRVKGGRPPKKSFPTLKEAVKLCPKCKAEVTEPAEYCMECGEKLL